MEDREARRHRLSQAILAEQDIWQEIMSLAGEQVLDVYLDIKSPHAYIAVRPTLQVARDYRVKLNILPYTLSYTALGVTTSVEADMQRRPASDAADRKARMYYAAARQYTELQQLPFRSPQRLLDSEVANRAVLFAKQQALEVPFLMHIYVAGWGNGWRDYEPESVSQLRQTLVDIGGDPAGFEDYVADGGAGQHALTRCMAAADQAGFAGVPHYVFTDAESQRPLGLFGREHLALIRARYHAAGLARNNRVQPDFSHAWVPDPAI